MTYITDTSSGFKSVNNSSTDNIGGSTTLDGSINDTVTTLTVVSTAQFPSSGIIKIENEFISYTSTTGTTFVGCTRGDFNSTAVSHSDTLAIIGVYIGISEKYPHPDVVVSLKSDQAGKEYFDFSNDNVNWDTFPVLGFDVSSNIHEYHSAVKGPRYFRIRFENTSGILTTNFRVNTYFGQFKQGNLPLNQTIGSDSDSIIVRSVNVGQQPDGDFVNTPSDGSAFSTDTTLSASQTFTSSWFDTDGYNSIEIFISSDVVSSFQGLLIDFTDNVQGSQTVRSTSKYDFNNFDVDKGFKILNIKNRLDGFRIRYINGTTSQSSFYLEATLKTNSSGENFAAGALQVADFLTEASLGRISNYKTKIIVGRNPNIGTTSDPETITEAGGIYAGFPTSTTPVSIEVVSSNANDTSAGTGARTIEIFGLKTNTSSFVESEIVTLNGTTPVVTSNNWWRIHKAIVKTVGSNGSNLGIISVRNVADTPVYTTIQIGSNSSFSGVYTVPANHKIIIKDITFIITRASGASGSATIILEIRDPSNSNNAFYPLKIFPIQTGMQMEKNYKGGLVIDEGYDIKMTVSSVSDNLTIAFGELEFIEISI